MNPKPIGKHRVADAFVKLLTELTDQLREARENRIKRHTFGIAGEAAYSALWDIKQGLRALNKYGASDMIDTIAVDGRADVEAIYSAVCRIIEEQCPNMEEVWG